MRDNDWGEWWNSWGLSDMATAVGAAVAGKEFVGAADVRGFCAYGSAQRVSAKDQWHLGSCTKLFTCCLWAKFVEQGRCDWSSPVATYFTGEFPIDDDWQTVTVGDLLRHRVSIARDLPPSLMYERWHDTDELTVQRTSIAMEALSAPTRPISYPRYSNIGYILVGAIIDRLGLDPFEQSLQKHILDELSIDSAGWGPPPRIRGHRARLRLGPFEFGRSSPRDPQSAYSDNPAVYSSAGTLHMTLRDVLSLLTAVVDPAVELLLPETRMKVLEVSCNQVAKTGMQPLEGSNTRFEIVGSNTMWSSAFVFDMQERRASVVVANDGRNRVVNAVNRLAHRLVVKSATAA